MLVIIAKLKTEKCFFLGSFVVGAKFGPSWYVVAPPPAFFLSNIPALLKANIHIQTPTGTY